MQHTRTTETVGTGPGILGGHHHNAADPTVGTGNAAAVGPTGTTHRGPVQVAADALTGRNNVSTGGVGASNVPQTGIGGGRHTAGMGTGTTAPMQTQAGVGTYGANAGVGTGRPNVVKRGVGEAEIIAGELTGNPALVAKGEQKKTGVPQTSQTTTQTTTGPGVGRY